MTDSTIWRDPGTLRPTPRLPEPEPDSGSPGDDDDNEPYYEAYEASGGDAAFGNEERVTRNAFDR